MKEPTPHLFAGWRFSALLIVITLSLVVYLLFTLWAGWEEVTYSFDKVGFTGILIPIGLSTLGYLLRFYRWTHFLHLLGHRIPLKESFRIYIGGFTFSITPGKTGEAIRGIFLKDFDVPYRQSFGAFLAERFSDVIAVFLLAMGGLLCCPQTRPMMAFALIFVLLILGFLQSKTLILKLEGWAKKILPESMADHIEFVLDTVLSFQKCFSFKTLIFAIGIGILAWGLESLGCYSLLVMLGMDISLFNVVFIYSFALLVGAITFLPAGLGGAEVTLIQLLVLYGVPNPIAVAVTIMIRLTTLWWSVLLGILFLPRNRLKIN